MKIKVLVLKNRYYIRLQHLMHFLRDECLIYLKPKGGDCYPIFDIDLSNQSLMRSIEDLISIDPLTCIIRNDKVLKNRGYNDGEPTWNSSMAEFFVNNGTAGRISNIYLNMNMVETLFKSNINKKGELSYITLYQLF